MLYPLSILSIFLLFLIHVTSGHQSHAHTSLPLSSKDTVPSSIRAYWMRRANAALAELDSLCPFGAFGTVIVNHTDLSEGPFGKEVCIGVNSVLSGNPTLHGEIAGINNCSKILTDPAGEYRMTPKDALLALHKLSLYTNAEPCPMCASAIRWSGFAECIFGTSIPTLIAKGWSQIDISAEKIFANANGLPDQTRLIQGVLANETDPYFSWQFDAGYPCPEGCARKSNHVCEKIEVKEARGGL